VAVQIGFEIGCFPTCVTLTDVPFVMPRMDMFFEVAASFIVKQMLEAWSMAFGQLVKAARQA
jgi:hypothetical protein